MTLEHYFPFFDQLTPAQKTLLNSSAVHRTAPKGTLLHNDASDCLGLIAVSAGQIRAFIYSEEGKEMTIYRLFERDICLFSASCIMRSLQFDITLTTEKDTSFWLIPSEVYSTLMEQSAPVANYTNEVMASRFSDVMWLMEQIMWRSFDQRLAAFLLEESTLEGSAALQITHDKIAAHLGTAREVVTRMLRYFQTEGLVTLSRGSVQLTDEPRLRRLAE